MYSTIWLEAATKNALDAIQGSGTITITTWHDATRVTITVRDTGCGLTPEELGGLFDPAFSAGRSRVKLGMGMLVSHQIIVHHHGELRVESTPGEGSIFTVELPKRSIAAPAAHI